VACVLADGTRCEVSNAVKLHIKLLGFSWNQLFKVLNGGPFLVILGLDFLRKTSMFIDVGSKRFSFRFAPIVLGNFGEVVKG
jgi:hypothetical protein